MARLRDLSPHQLVELVGDYLTEASPVTRSQALGRLVELIGRWHQVPTVGRAPVEPGRDLRGVPHVLAVPGRWPRARRVGAVVSPGGGSALASGRGVESRPGGRGNKIRNNPSRYDQDERNRNAARHV